MAQHTHMARILLPSALLCAVLAHGCSKPTTYAANCSKPLEHWKTPSDGYDDGLRNEVRVDKLGHITWNRMKISNERYRYYLSQVPTFEPPPEMIVMFDPETDCATVNRIRREIEENLSCGKLLSCGEGEGDWKGNTHISHIPAPEFRQ